MEVVMDVRRYCLAAALLFLPCSAHASGHNFDAAAGFSKVGVKKNTAQAALTGTKSISGADDDDVSVYGWHGVGALTFHSKNPGPHGDFWRKVAVVGDVSGHFIQSDNGGLPDLQQIVFLLGPRFEIPFFEKKVSVMLQFLPFGFRLGNDDQTAVVASGGASVDTKTGISGLRFRLVYDRLIIRGPLKGQGRISALLTHRFGDD
jgi:hypothetical protein